MQAFYVVKALSNTQAARPPISGRSKLMIMYTRSCPPLLEVVRFVINVSTGCIMLTKKFPSSLMTEVVSIWNVRQYSPSCTV